MRGKVIAVDRDEIAFGITPAYAGKSTPESVPTAQCRDHPRICGEKSVSKVETKLMPGLPPHVQGKGLRDVLVPKPLGITPAYAGKSRCGSSASPRGWEHPRICGEKASMPLVSSSV